MRETVIRACQHDRMDMACRFPVNSIRKWRGQLTDGNDCGSIRADCTAVPEVARKGQSAGQSGRSCRFGDIPLVRIAPPLKSTRTPWRLRVEKRIVLRGTIQSWAGISCNSAEQARLAGLLESSRMILDAEPSIDAFERDQYNSRLEDAANSKIKQLEEHAPEWTDSEKAKGPHP